MAFQRLIASSTRRTDACIKWQSLDRSQSRLSLWAPPLKSLCLLFLSHFPSFPSTSSKSSLVFFVKHKHLLYFIRAFCMYIKMLHLLYCLFPRIRLFLCFCHCLVKYIVDCLRFCSENCQNFRK